MSDERNVEVPGNAAVLVISPEEINLIWPKDADDSAPVPLHVMLVAYMAMRMEHDPEWVTDLLNWGADKLESVQDGPA